MSLDRLTKITGPGIKTDTNWVGNNANFTGVTTAGSSFNIGVTTIHSTLAEVHNIKSTGIITATGAHFSGNVSIAGTLTYEDVTNVDTVGIITAAAVDVDDFLDVGSNIKLGNAGVITATSFVGDGSGLIGVASTDNIVTGTAATFTGGVDINSDLDVDGHTNLDNVSIAGVTTASDNISIVKSSGPILELTTNTNGADSSLRLHEGTTGSTTNGGGMYYSGANNKLYITCGTTLTTERITIDRDTGNVAVANDLDVDGHTNLDNVSIAGVTTTGNLSGSNANFTGELTVAEMVGHTGDTHTKLSFPANDTIAFTTGGTERARINSSGLIGIGTATVRNNRAMQLTGESNSLFLITGHAPSICLNRDPDDSSDADRSFFGVSSVSNGFANGTAAGDTIIRGNSSGKIIFAISSSIKMNLTSAGDLNVGTVGRFDASGLVKTADGTESAPSHTFLNDPDNGMYRPTTNTLGFVTGGAEKLRILANGAVGINTSNFSSVLNNEAGLAIHGSSNDNCRINLSTPNKSNTLIGYYGLSNRFGVDVHNGLEIRDVEDSYATRLRIDSSGRVLIGTTDTHGADADDLVVATSGTTGITIRSGTSGSGNIYFADGNSGTNLYRGRVSYYHGDDSLFLGTANSNNSLKISSDGKIGLRHDLSGTADYNRMMIYNPNSGSCWIQLMSTATGNGANTDGLSIGLNTSNIAHFWLRENAEMQFATNNSLRWRITSSGDVYPQGNYNIGLNSNTAFRMNEVNSVKFVHRYGVSGSATTNQREAIWYGGGITVMHDNQTLQTTNYTWGLTGSRGYPLLRVRNANAGGGAIYSESGGITSGSDYRMKENIEEITNGIETVKKLKPSKYNIRKSFNPEDDGTKHHGFIAHEVQEAIPDIGNIVTGTKDAMEEVFYQDEDENIPEGKKPGDSTGTFTDNPDMQGIDYGHMTPVLAAAIKELITKVETLEAEVATLKGS